MNKLRYFGAPQDKVLISSLVFLVKLSSLAGYYRLHETANHSSPISTSSSCVCNANSLYFSDRALIALSCLSR